ncbi:MAG: FumA C-terminus/TtdB family hydratase beta subunit [Peptococcaceae bacterium]|nr:FumA C-terminus/TtdB family hydratase beta subunit [Peptococcaceae bacterium]
MSVRMALPPDPVDLAPLRAGDKVLLNGSVYTARDAAHQKIAAALERGDTLPFDPHGQVIYYTGPTPAGITPAGSQRIIGSAGPTTSGRMDVYTPALLQAGLAAMIGKGQRRPEVVEAIRTHQAVYFAAVGGTGALLAQKIVSAEVVAYPELGPEAVHRLCIEDFPAVVAVDCHGNDLYELGRRLFEVRDL